MTALALVATLGFLLIAAALRAAGASLVRTSRADALHDGAEGDRRARLVAEVLEDRAGIQPALGILHSGLLVAAAVPGAWALTEELTDLGLVLGLVLMGIALVLVGDVLPRSWGRAHPRRLAYRFAPLVVGAVRLGNRAVDLISEDNEVAEVVGEDAAHDEEERELISSVLDFTDAVVREVMVPRTDMTSVSSGVSTDDAREIVLKEGYSRIPVTRRGPDDIVGVVYAKDLLQLERQGVGPKPVAEVMRSAYFVPETKRVSTLLREMQGDQVHLAIVVDEFGGTAGLVTIEDILEELVGEIADEFDSEEPMVTSLGEGVYLVDARLPVAELGQLFEVELPDEEWDTVGGLVLALAGRVPKEGETFELSDLKLTADRVQGRRVARVRCTRV